MYICIRTLLSTYRNIHIYTISRQLSLASSKMLPQALTAVRSYSIMQFITLSHRPITVSYSTLVTSYPFTQMLAQTHTHVFSYIIVRMYDRKGTKSHLFIYILVCMYVDVSVCVRAQVYK